MSRFESDFLGQLEIPDDCYYGVQTLRGKENFHITEMPMSQEPFFVIAYGYVKKAAAMTNKELGKRLFISEATVKTHLAHIYAKLGVESRAAAVSIALRRDGIR